MTSGIVLGELKTNSLPDAATDVAIMPSIIGRADLCLLLMAGGASRQSLLDFQKI